jgi:aspartyl aminopeptidase
MIALAPDVGNPQLSMHSIREMAGTKDIDHAMRLFEVRDGTASFG